MTISSTNRKAGPYVGNDTATDFPFAFKVFSASDLLVVRADANGDETDLILDTNYTVALNANQDANPGGTITLPAALATGYTLVIASKLENLQPADLTNNGGFYPKVINNALDRLTILIQQLAESVARSLKMAITTPPGVESQLPAPVPYAVIGWNADGTGFVNVDPSYATALAPDLASTEAGKGAALVGYSTTGETTKAALDARLPVIGNYIALRNYNGALTSFYVMGAANLFDGGAGVFRVDAGDVASADNGGIILVDAAGRRWKREAPGPLDVRWFGAVAGADCAAAVIAAAAATTGALLVPAGAFVATGTTANSGALLAALSRVRCDGTLTINLAAGLHPLAAQIIVNSPDAQRIQVLGAAPVQTTATSQVSVSGAAKAYSVTIAVASSAGAAVGDYAIIRTDVTGTGDFYAHAGVWKITAVDSGGANRLTLLNTHHGAAFPTNTLTGGTVVILKTTLQFTACDGFRLEGGQSLGLLNNVAIVGDWNVAAGTGTTGAHGIIMGSPRVLPGDSSNTVFNVAGGGAVGPHVGVSGWGEQGIALSMRGALVANFVASCSNRKRGWYAEGSSVRAKFAIASGNGEDGFLSDTTGFIQAALGIACGNGLNGYWSTNHSMIACAAAIASGNLLNGFECRGMGRLGADNAVSINNGGVGFSASDGGMIDADSATATGNAAQGFDAGSGSVIDCDNSTSTGNTGYGYRSQYGSVVRAAGSTVSGNTSGNYYNRDGSVLFESGGGVSVQDVPTYSVGHRLYNSTKANYYGLAVTGVGDLALTAGATSRYTMKADGVFHPAADNTQSLGRSSERWSVVYAGTGTINTSDAREKQQVRDMSDAERRVAARLKGLLRAFKFNDAVQEKGNGARIHFGVLAQDVRAAFEAEGLDPFSYALLCYDEWPEQAEEHDEEGNVVVPYRAAGERYGVRYDELSMFIIGAI